MTSLAMKRVLVTGAGAGIGREISLACARQGAEIVLTDRDPAALETTRADVEATGARCRTYELDVTDHEQILAVRDALHARAGTVDVLINNAGVVFGGRFEDVPLERHLKTYEVNVAGLVAVTHAFFQDVLAAPRGHFVFIASASGFIGLPNGSTYASSKWAAIGFAESIRAELDHRDVGHVGVTTVCPSYVDTGLFEGVAPPTSTRMLKPDELAGKVVEGIEQDKVWVLEPWIVKLTPFIKHGLPTSVGDTIARVLGANASMDSWRGHGN